ncbi:hypothetical protein ACWDOP_00190 [Nocardia sp. NPDC003693]
MFLEVREKKETHDDFRSRTRRLEGLLGVRGAWWSTANEYFREMIAAGAADTGYSVRPPGGGDPRRRPHPLASFLQTIRLTGAVDLVPRREFVYCSGWQDHTPFTELRTRLDADPGWQVHELPTGHDAMNEAPEAVAALLLDE